MAEIDELDDATVAALLPRRDESSHKGSTGKLLVLAGSLDYAGAAILVATAAGRAGVGVVRIAVPASLQQLFAGRVMEATTLALPEGDGEAEVDPEAAMELILDTDHDALVMGPGLRPGLATVELVVALLGIEGRSPPAVVDAEALDSLASVREWWQATRRSCVLTPHPGEFARLLADGGGDVTRVMAGDDAARAEAAAAAARTWRQIVVLKGARTVIAAPDGRVARAPFANPALASGGTGDVLAGVIGALLAQGLEAYDAARAGVYLHGLAGEQVRARLGDAGLLASDLFAELPLARRRLTGLAS